MYPENNQPALVQEMAASGGVTAGIGIAALLGMHKTGIGSQMVRGAQISFLGMDPAYAASNMGSVFATGEQGAKALKTGLRGYGFLNSLSNVDESKLFTANLSGDLKTGGLAKMNKLNVALPIAASAIGLIHAGATEGGQGLVDYAIQDVLAMNAATNQNNQVLRIANVNKAGKHFGLSQAAKNTINARKGLTGESTYLNTQSKMFGSPLLGNMRTIAGGLMGADLLMDAGRGLGKFAARQLSDKGYGESALGFAGGIFGAAAGAQMGAFAFASLPRAMTLGVGIAAATMVSKGIYSTLESGFSKQRKSRGLNFASDTSQFMTQQAVTARQRAIQAMHKSHLNARSAFGQEATITHMNRDMFSHYKRL